MCPKYAQNEVFQVLPKLSAWIFSEFLHEFRVFRAKISKMGFYKYYQKSVHGAFLTFYKKLEQHKDLKLSQIIAFGIILF